ncbi:MAG: hypothetical protein KY468_05930 [Armatimonadetes bacterium]|nr:hypothetical protein [Armatimonadota bacterium]
MFAALGWIFQIIALVLFLIIVIDAFKNEIWKGILAFFCCFYTLYYGLTEYESEKKTLIVGGWIASVILSGIFQVMARGGS